MITLLLLLLGLFSGLLGGLLGIGGGVVIVPALYYLLSSLLLEGPIMQITIATSLAASFFTSAIACYLQLKKKAIHLRATLFLLPGLVLGSICGAILAYYLSSEILSKAFGVMALFLGGFFCLTKSPHLNIFQKPNPSLSVFGMIIGTLSSLLGIGGGSLTFPTLLGYKVPVQKCSATAAASTCITTFIGSIVYILIARDQALLPYSLGYINLPVLIAISAGSIVTTPIGVYLIHKLNQALIKKIFGVSLGVIGLTMIF